MRCTSFLCLGDIEVGNANRTLTYVRRGQASLQFEVGIVPHPVSSFIYHEWIDDYQDNYTDTYGRVLDTVDNIFTPSNLLCYCSGFDAGPYVDPETDEAPWFSAARPESGEFLGLLPLLVEVQPTLGRGAAHGAFGAAVGPPRAGGQMLAVQGALYAATARGMAYGERWLAEVLSGSLCGGDMDAVVLPGCAPDENPGWPDENQEWRTLRHVGLVDGPVTQDVQGVPACNLREVAFQIASESPFLVADPIAVVTDATLANTSLSYEVTTEEWNGDAGLRITLLAGHEAPLVVRCAAGSAPDGCPSPYEGSCWDWTTSIPAGHELVVDGVDRTVTLLNPATNEIVGGLDYLDYEGLFRWPEVAPCSTVCVKVSPSQAPSGSRLTIESYGREL